MEKNFDKKAQIGHGIIWLYKIIMLIIIIGGIVFIVAFNYSKNYDARETESSLIASKIMDCFAPRGIISNFDASVLNSCLNFNENEVFIALTLKDKKIEYGKTDLWAYCTGSKEIEGKYMPACFEQEYDVFYNNNLEKMKISISLLKTEKNT